MKLTDSRNLKVLLSIGGWTYSPVSTMPKHELVKDGLNKENFAGITNPAWRQEFVRSSLQLVEDVGLDG